MKRVLFLVLAVFFSVYTTKSVRAAVPTGVLSCTSCGCKCQLTTADCAQDTPACTYDISCGLVDGSCQETGPLEPDDTKKAPLQISLAKDPFVASSGTTALTIDNSEGYWIDTGLGAGAPAYVNMLKIYNEHIGVTTEEYVFNANARFEEGRIYIAPYSGTDAYVPRILKIKYNRPLATWSNPVYLTRLDPNANSKLVFELPNEGQTLDLEGDYIFKVNDTLGASEYEWKVVQGQNILSEIKVGKTGVAGSRADFRIDTTNPKHGLFKEGPAVVSVRKKAYGVWKDWTNLNIKLVSRYFLRCQDEPACLKAKPACNLPEPGEGWCMPTNFKTEYVQMAVKNLNIKIGDEVYNPQRGKDLQVHSSPPYTENGKTRTTLELTWFEFDKEMRVFMYFELDNALNMWKMYELRTYNAETKGDWLYYDVKDYNTYSGLGEGDHMVNPAKRYFAMGDRFASLDVEGMDLNINFGTKIESCSCPAGVPTKASGNANCDGVIDQADFNLWKSERFNSDGTPRTVPFTPPGPGTFGSQSDFNCDSKIDNLDYEFWLNSYKAR